MLTDFAADPYKFTRLLIRMDRGDALRAGRAVQRLLDIETYRTMALLGLRDARRASPEVARMEGEIAEINRELSQTEGAQTNQHLLKRLSDLMASCEALSTRTAFRFGASRAYHAVIKNRLELIREEKEGSYTTISGFFSARLDPAIETCNSVEIRLARLSTQVQRAIGLERSPINLYHIRRRRSNLRIRRV